MIPNVGNLVLGQKHNKEKKKKHLIKQKTKTYYLSTWIMECKKQDKKEP